MDKKEFKAKCHLLMEAFSFKNELSREVLLDEIYKLADILIVEYNYNENRSFIAKLERWITGYKDLSETVNISKEKKEEFLIRIKEVNDVIGKLQDFNIKGGGRK